MYRVWLEEVLGFKLRAGRLSIDPVIPEDWPGYVLTFRYGRAEYRIEVDNGGERSEQEIQLVDDGESHAIHIHAGAPASRALVEAAATT
jgi:cellobiose phosphorylase